MPFKGLCYFYYEFNLQSNFWCYCRDSEESDLILSQPVFHILFVELVDMIFFCEGRERESRDYDRRMKINK